MFQSSRHLLQKDIQSVFDQSAFTSWQEFSAFCQMPEIRQRGGLYAIRAHGEAAWMYIGATNCLLIDPLVNIKRALSGTTFPGHEPHTAGAHLWWRMRRHDVRYDVSVAPFPLLSPSERLWLKSLALALHRQTHQQSPFANYSRLPYDLGLSDERVRFSQQRFQPGAPPLGSITSFGAYQSRHWGHYIWSPWIPLVQLQPHSLPALPLTRADRGFFRLRRRSDGTPLFVGHGSIYTTLLVWQYRQKEIPLRDLECSWVRTSLPNHVSRERLDDLRAGLLLTFHGFPITQSACRVTGQDMASSMEPSVTSLLVA